MGRKHTKKRTIKKGGVSRVKSASLGRKSNSRKSKSIKSTDSVPRLNIGLRDPLPRKGETREKYMTRLKRKRSMRNLHKKKAQNRKDIEVRKRKDVARQRGAPSRARSIRGLPLPDDLIRKLSNIY